MSAGDLGRIGFICPFWLPLWGGAEQYHARLAQALRHIGFDVRILCATAEAPDRDNGSMDADRFVGAGSMGFASWRAALRTRSHQSYRELAKHYAFIEEAVRWCRENRIRIALVGNPIQDADNFHARELYLRLKDYGIKVGIIHHDLPQIVSENLKKVYQHPNGTWGIAARKVIDSLKALAEAAVHRTEWAAMTGSPLFFEPDFVISNSAWSARFIDPLNQCSKFVLHPLIDAAYWSSAPQEPAALESRQVLMINPQKRKNPELMAKVMLEGRDGLTFRVLKGGWGNAFDIFRPMLEALPPEASERIDFREYVHDMRQAYRSAQLLLYPSFEEGYGMSAVEAMYCGIPVISSNYPAIIEAIGDGAYALCPYKDPPEKWMAAIEEVLTDIGRWREMALRRRAELSARQAKEIRDLVVFLRQRL